MVIKTTTMAMEYLFKTTHLVLNRFFIYMYNNFYYNFHIFYLEKFSKDQTNIIIDQTKISIDNGLQKIENNVDTTIKNTVNTVNKKLPKNEINILPSGDMPLPRVTRSKDGSNINVVYEQRFGDQLKTPFDINSSNIPVDIGTKNSQKQPQALCRAKAAEGLYQKHAELLKLISETESMDCDDRQFWYDKLPTMTENQSNQLLDILRTERKNSKNWR